MATSQDQEDVPNWSLPGFAELGELGAGGQGRVVLAQSVTAHPGRLVAIKYLRSGLLRNEHELTTFRNEARMLARVNDPHIARLERYAETSQGAAIVMEAVNGRSLRAVLDERETPLEPEGALALLKGSLLGLASAHAVGVIHRDYKPANVIVEDSGGSKLVDFGIAVLTGGRGQSGTPSYMAPEQWAGGPATPATDIYAATCVFYECITGRIPFRGMTIPSLMHQHVTAPIPSDLAPEAVRPLIERGMAKNPGQRAWDAAQFVRELEEIAITEYGPDWERRGLVILGAAAAMLATTFPLAVLASISAAPGIGAAGAATGHVAGQVTGATGSAAQGWLAKAGGSKAVVGASGVAAVAVTAWLLWPAEPTVGGTSSGAFRLTVGKPSVLLANPALPNGEIASPSAEWTMSVSPARVRTGTKVRISTRTHNRAPWGIEYSGAGHLVCHEPNSEREDAYHHAYSFGLGTGSATALPEGAGAVWLIKAPDNPTAELPKSSGFRITGSERTTNKQKGYRNDDCSWHFDNTTVTEITMPSSLPLKPGQYLVSSVEGPGLFTVRATVNGKLTEVSPRSIEAKISGRLPVITVIGD